MDTTSPVSNPSDVTMETNEAEEVAEDNQAEDSAYQFVSSALATLVQRQQEENNDQCENWTHQQTAMLFFHDKVFILRLYKDYHVNNSFQKQQFNMFAIIFINFK